VYVDKLEKIFGFCGISCSDCPVLAATLKNDNGERQRIAEIFTRQYGKEYKPDDINCDGCLSNSQRVFSYCGICDSRKCGKEKKVKNCAFCTDYPCEKLSELFAKYSKARENFESIKHENNIN
jgi:hypothetical protein